MSDLPKLPNCSDVYRKQKRHRDGQLVELGKSDTIPDDVSHRARIREAHWAQRKPMLSLRVVGSPLTRYEVRRSLA